MDNNNQILILRDNAKRELLQIQSVEEGISYLNKLKSIDTWVKAEKKDAELQNIVAEQKLRTQRILGELIADGQRKGKIASRESFAGNQYVVSDREEDTKTLEEIGITHKQSSAFQAIASIPDEDFEEFIHEKKTAVNNAVAELTTSGAVRLARSLQDRRQDMEASIEISEKLAIDKELRALAKEINLKYTKEQRQFFVSLIKQ